MAAVVDADPCGERVAQEAADDKGGHEFFALHVYGPGDEDEGRERHRRREQRGQSDGEDGVVFHPAGDGLEEAFGDVLFKEGHAPGAASGVGEIASDGGAQRGEADEKEEVRLAGGVQDDHDVGDAGDGQRYERAVDG